MAVGAIAHGLDPAQAPPWGGDAHFRRRVFAPLICVLIVHPHVCMGPRAQSPEQRLDVRLRSPHDSIPPHGSAGLLVREEPLDPGLPRPILRMPGLDRCIRYRDVPIFPQFRPQDVARGDKCLCGVAHAAGYSIVPTHREGISDRVGPHGWLRRRVRAPCLRGCARGAVIIPCQIVEPERTSHCAPWQHAPRNQHGLSKACYPFPWGARPEVVLPPVPFLCEVQHFG